MKLIKLFENFDVTAEIIPLDIIIWALEHYYGNYKPDVELPQISKKIHNESIKYIKQGKNDGYLYRGMGWKNKQELIQNTQKQGGIQLDGPTSWSTEFKNAEEFARGILIKYPLSQFKMILSMDYVMNSVTQDQLKQLANIKYHGYDLANTHAFYESENEVVVFDKLWIPIENITIEEL